jgi:hypothetical protein
MFNLKARDHQSGKGNLAGRAPEANGGHHQPGGRRGGALTKVVAAGAGTGALLAALAVPAAAAGAPSPWEGAQVGLTYPVYQPKTVLSLPLSDFKLLSCTPGQDESVSAIYGSGFRSPVNAGKTTGFLVAEGYPQVCFIPGAAKGVGTWTVGIPNGTVKVGVSVYCAPAQFKTCTTASGVKNGYVLQWAQPYKSTQFLKKQTEIIVETSKLTLAQALHIVAGLRSL